jgi:hypothetical protein
MPRKSWWARLPFGVRMVAGASAVLLVFGGGVAVVALLTRHPAEPRFGTAVGDAAIGDGAPAPVKPEPALTPPFPPITKGPVGADAVRLRTAAKADRTAIRHPMHGPAPAAAAAPLPAEPRSETIGPPAPAPAPAPARPVITTRIQAATSEIPYSTRTVRDPSLPEGVREVQSPGVAGERTVRYLLTLTDGRQTGRRLLDSTVTRPPQPQIVTLGEETDDQQSGGWHRHGRGGHHADCGDFDVCMPLGRDSACLDGYDQWAEAGDEVTVYQDGVELRSGSAC